MERLKELRQHPAWRHLQALWERVAQHEYDKFAGGLAYDDYLAVVGAYQACLRNLELVDTLIEKVDEHNARKRDTTDTDRDNARSIFFSSPEWRAL